MKTRELKSFDTPLVFQGQGQRLFLSCIILLAMLFNTHSCTTTLRMTTMCTQCWKCVRTESSTGTSKPLEKDSLRMKVHHLATRLSHLALGQVHVSCKPVRLILLCLQLGGFSGRLYKVCSTCTHTRSFTGTSVFPTCCSPEPWMPYVLTHYNCTIFKPQLNLKPPKFAKTQLFNPKFISPFM